MLAKFPLTAVIAAIVFWAIGGIKMAYADPAVGAFRLSYAELIGKVAEIVDGLAVSPLPTGPDATVLDVRRGKSAQVELHKNKNDFIVAHAGHATILVGTEVKGSKKTMIGEWRGGTLTNRIDLKFLRVMCFGFQQDRLIRSSSRLAPHLII